MQSMISVIVPALNEGNGLKEFYDELIKYLPELSKTYEILFIDDGSTDNTLEVMKALAQKDKHIRIFSFKKNRQKADALALGFSEAKGELIFTMDADLQDKPSEMHKFLSKQKQGVDVICGWRKERRDKSKMVIISRFFNWVNRVIFGLTLHDIDCGFKLFTKDALQHLHIYAGLYRFIPLLLHQQGYMVDEVVVEHDKRQYGKSKYGFSKIFKNLPDLFTIIFLLKFGKRPLHFFGFIGIVFLLIGLGMVGYLTYIHYVYSVRVGTRPLLFVGILFITTGLQTFFTGFLADLLIHISHNNRLQSDYTDKFPLKYESSK